MTTPDQCGASDAPIPSGGSVRCLCGKHWPDHDKAGEPRFRVPLHTVAGYPTDEAKIARLINHAIEVRRKRDQDRAFVRALEVARSIAAMRLIDGKVLPMGRRDDKHDGVR